MDDFERFWAAYPRRDKKQEALRAWTKLRPDSTLVALMLQRLETQTINLKWKFIEKRFIPLPASWLNGRRWEDESATPAQCCNTSYDLEEFKALMNQF